MNYLTAGEMAKVWKISSRMVAYYCKAGKVDGAVKKGKTWLLPENADKPYDNRLSKNKMIVGDNLELQGELPRINSMDSDNTSVYRANDLYKNLGLTRETLRYYERAGLIAPERNRSSQYREFTFEDVSRLMSIDFYKKRGFTTLEIRELMRSAEHGGTELLDQKLIDIENSIRMQQRIIKRLTETKTFCESAMLSEEKFSIKELPLYLVLETFDAVTSLNDYKERVLACVDLQEEDILSSLVRAVTFDRSGYKGTKMCIVKQALRKEQEAGTWYLEHGRCLYTVLTADSHDDSLMERMFYAAYQWAGEHRENFRGIVYIFIRFVELSGKSERNFYEVYIPLDR